MARVEELKRELNALYDQYHRAELLGEDPLGLVSHTLSNSDFELVSYVSASLSYGRVEQIRKSLQSLWTRFEILGLGPGGKGLHAYLVDKSRKSLKQDLSKVLRGWVHRFNDEEDIAVLFQILQSVALSSGSMGELYAATPTEKSPTERFEAFVSSLRSHAKGREFELFRWFACSPQEGSTCKRMVMWLRWMLRSDEIDPGLWTQNKNFQRADVGAHLAFIPMDTHVHKWARERSLLSTKNPSWKAVEELTSILRQVDPQDPARFDFCICHSGMRRFRDGFKDQSSL